MQIHILFGILYELINNSRLSREELSVKLETSTRTISRYVNYLGLCGIPVYTVSGPHGGYALPDDYRLDRGYLSVDERLRIINSLKATDNNFDDSLNGHIISKLTAICKGERENFIVRSDTLVIDAGAWNNPKAYQSKIEVISNAIDENRSLQLSYIDRHEYSTKRLFDPHCIALKEGIWYVYGFCHTRQDFRLFKLARITNLIKTADKFERRPFDIYSKLKGNFDDSNLVRFTIQFSNFVLPEIEEWLGLESISERGTHYIAKAELYGGNVLLSKLLSFGSSIKILSPQALKEELLIECKRILANS